MTEQDTPVFVLCCSRTGSTLLRYILDSHPDFCCPPELHLAKLARSLAVVYSVTLAGDADGSRRGLEGVIAKRIHETIADIMAEYLRTRGKRIWCEKSVFTIDHIEFIDLAFPSARYLCLYRNCLDQLASALDTLSRDVTGKAYGFEPYLSRNRMDPWNALADYWIAKTRKVLAYEKLKPDQCIRLRYEDIVMNAEAELKILFESLHSQWSHDMTASIFDRARKGGRGDQKIGQTDGIVKSSVGRGQHLLEKLTGDSRRRINELHEILGYPPLDA